MSFWIVAALMTAGVAALLLWPTRRQPETVANEGEGGPDLAVYRDQLAEVDRDLARGLIDPGQAEAARIEISRRMLAAAGRGTGRGVGTTAWTRAVILAVAVILPLAAIALYLPGGRPDLPSQPFAERDSGQRDRLVAERAATEALLRRLNAEPDDLAGWVELGQRFRALGQADQAASAYARAA
ncbi:MAG: c-type cytochrome biogenesis protein CcmI, partial [Inquilinus sp.]|nr:c-type cytochrome biogenesis protein CcmI [Inquilinus sp.]